MKTTTIAHWFLLVLMVFWALMIPMDLAAGSFVSAIGDFVWAISLWGISAFLGRVSSETNL